MWGTNANCYAYACNCKTPKIGIFGAALPGGYAGDAVTKKQNQTSDEYYARLVFGIRQDAHKNGVKHVQVSRTVTQLPFEGSGYIIAMLVQPTGFHFLRRDRFKKTWTEKNGNEGEVEGKIYNNYSETSVEMTDAVVIETLRGLSNRYMSWNPLKFYAYIGLGEIKGMTVSGAV
jgi:hypothetical protein